MKTNPLPEYKSASLMGPTGVARRTMPSNPLLRSGTKYTPAAATDIRKAFARAKKEFKE